MNRKTLLEEQLYIRFRSRNPEMVMGWMQYFSGAGPWSVGVGNILGEKADAIVSPSNSYGYMDGGIDLAYRNFFGLGIETRLKRVIDENYGGFLPIGKAVVVPTGHPHIPRMISAPTMSTPGDISKTDNVYSAMKAVLEKALAYNHVERERSGRQLNTILVPGMGTGVGRMDQFEAAKQMRDAVDRVIADLRERGNSIDYLLE